MRAPISPGVFVVLLVAAGCRCDPFGVEGTRFVCSSQADCADGFECRARGEGLECVLAGTPQDAGADAGGVDAGGVDAGEVDAGASDAGTDAGADAGSAEPFRLRFATAPQSIISGACSQIIAVETVNDGGVVTAVTNATVVSLSASPNTVSFFTASNCTGTATTDVTIGASTAAVSFYANAAPVGTYTLTASAAPLASATQQLVAQNAPTSLVFTSTPPVPVRGGTCLPASVQSRRTGVATPVISATNLGLTAVPPTGTRFYSDAACTQSTASATLAAGSSTANFFVKPLTAGMNSITAAAPFGSANQGIDTTPIVRRATCTYVARVPLPDGGAVTDTNTSCSLSPALTDLNASLLLSQATATLSGGEVGVAEVRCRLAATNRVDCTRRQDLDPATVHVQVAEVPQGMLVQRFSSFSCPAVNTLPTPVNLARSFVLKAVSNSTGTFDDEDVAVAELTSPTTFSVTPTSCNGFDIQVVEWAGVTVTRGTVDGGVPAGAFTTPVTGLPAASNERALLLQPGTSFNGGRQVCSTMVRGAMPSPSSFVLTRAAGDVACASLAMENVHYERIDFGGKASVREYTVSLPAGDTSATVTITPVDVTRTIVFSSSQGAGGQGAGETSFAGDDYFTEGTFQLVLTNTNTVTATRGQASSNAQVSFYVAELVP